jgi:hypothetical protein
VVVAGDGSSTAPADTQVQVRDAQGNVLGSAQVAGSFTIGLTPAQANGKPLVAVDEAQQFAADPDHRPDITPPNEASELQLSADGGLLTGRGEPAPPCRSSAPTGTVLGNAQVGADGVISVVLNPAQTDGQELDVVLRDRWQHLDRQHRARYRRPAATLRAGHRYRWHSPYRPGSKRLHRQRDADGNVLGTATGRRRPFDVTLNAHSAMAKA